MAGAERKAVYRLLALGFVATVAAGAASAALDLGAERAREVERAKGWCRALAQVAGAEVSGGGHSGQPLGSLVAAVVRTEPGVAFLRVEAGDGRVLGQAGDAGRARAWEDRTFGQERGSVRVRVGYRPGSQPLALAVRALLWALLTGGLWALGAAVVAWTLRGDRPRP